MLDSSPVSIHFSIPPTDHLGREEVQGQLHFGAEQLDLHWRLKDNVFRDSKDGLKTVPIPYAKVAEVRLKKRWFRPPQLVLRLDDPTLTAEIPGVQLGHLILELDADSKVETEKLNSFIDFRRSIFLLDETNQRLDANEG